MTTLYCAQAMLPEGWARGVLIEIDATGAIAAIRRGPPENDDIRARGPVLPGMPNLHSHAFQRAMAGLAEVSGAGADSFWTWRRLMYAFTARLDPEDVEAIAAQLYVEMLRAGYTAVGEFHYLHHGRDGRPYDDPAELSERVIAAAARTGIGITHLPVLYARGGFRDAPAGAEQARFVLDGDHFLDLVATLRRRHGDDPNVAVGIAPHSLRAVPAALLAEAVAGFAAMESGGAIHIHVAEQQQEVADCLEETGQPPVAWLLDHAPVDRRWCLVHATHVSAAETAALAARDAVVGLCPTTEANLGDGLFPARAYCARGGRFGIGSDSHTSVNVAEELRWLEYGQRLTHQSRAVLAGGPSRATGAALYRAALAGGAQALARPLGVIAPGYRADFVVLDADSPVLAARDGDRLVDSWLFAGIGNPVRDVMVGGRFVLRDGRHEDEAAIAAAYGKTLAHLLD